MGQQEKISRALEFVGNAKHKQNVEGPMFEKMVHIHDHFTGITLDNEDWTATIPATSDSIEISAGIGGLCLLTLGNADDDTIMLSSQIIFEADKNCVAEVRLKVTDITDTACFFGFTDAIGESDGAMAIAFDANTVTSGADNAVGFVLDVDATTLGADEWLCCGIYGNTDAVNFSSGVTAVSDTYVTLRVELKAGTTYASADFYINGTSVGHFASTASLGATLTGTDLCVAVHGENRDSTAGTIYVDRIDAWQDEG